MFKASRKMCSSNNESKRWVAVAEAEAAVSSHFFMDEIKREKTRRRRNKSNYQAKPRQSASCESSKAVERRDGIKTRSVHFMHLLAGALLALPDLNAIRTGALQTTESRVACQVTPGASISVDGTVPSVYDFMCECGCGL